MAFEGTAPKVKKARKVYVRPRDFEYGFDATILNGLPCTIWYNVEPSDSSVGISGGVVEWYITRTDNRPFGQWILDRIADTKGETNRIYDICERDYINGN